MLKRRINIHAQDSHVTSLRRREKKKIGLPKKYGVVKRTAYKQPSELYAPAMAIAHLLCPGNFPRIIASGLDRKTVFSNEIQLDKPSQKAINSYYRRRARSVKKAKPVEKSRKYLEHEARVKKSALQLAREIEEETGMRPNLKAMNIGFSAGGNFPIFFEVSRINIPVLEKRIKSIVLATQRAQALELLDLIKREAQGQKIVKVHP
ncbi:MAG: hypothetical protein JW772_02765 [Candidatus Diapherotrites archaeon]|nr:hypothetical protein [Candidatus Diapherotrites archaeon]